MKKKAQSILEYAVLIGVVSLALVAMYQYIYRAMNAKLKEVQNEFYPQSRLEAPRSGAGAGVGSGRGVSPGTGSGSTQGGGSGAGAQ